MVYRKGVKGEMGEGADLDTLPINYRNPKQPLLFCIILSQLCLHIFLQSKTHTLTSSIAAATPPTCAWCSTALHWVFISRFLVGVISAVLCEYLRHKVVIN